MDSQIVSHVGNELELESRNIPHHQSEEDEGQHEKKSVLKKVKAKAKKMKETITKHGHIAKEEDDDHDQMLDDPQNPAGAGRPEATHDQNIPPITNKYTDETTSRLVDPDRKTTLKEADDSGVVPSTKLSLSRSEPEIRFGGPVTLKQDPHAPSKGSTRVESPRNYEVNVADPAGRGSKEVEASGIVDSFAKMNVKDEEEEEDTKQRPLEEAVLSSGSHDQFSPEREDKGVSLSVSVREYLAQKMKPSEEDRALSEVISEALQRRKEQPKGTVTESEEVRRWLGEEDRDGDGEKTVGVSAAETGRGVLHKLKETVGSWWPGKAGADSSGVGGN